MQFKVYKFGELSNHFSADIMAVYNNKWVFCMHKERDTWENPSGHIEKGETPLEAAKRELYEETGAVEFDIVPLCDYYIDGHQNGEYYKGAGQVYLAEIYKLDEIPEMSEMRCIDFFSELPDKLTYPILKDFFHIALEKRSIML